ncbi:MAG: 4-hydroxy-tetrahydrodipicolinate reductase [Paludibacteraceae bacterium]|nr:4-hydroxy-tetrahydrodipicolinate reductase [Paludibacteraceae bacterium]
MRIAIIGYGKMGHMIEHIALERGHEIVGVIDPTLFIGDGSSVIGFDSPVFRSADVAIEFTTPSTAEQNIRAAWAQGVPVVSGSTGWNVDNLSPALSSREGDKTRVTIKDKDGKTMLIWSSNFSVGVNIVFELNQLLADMMAKQPQYAPALKEIHHIHKLDAPSGTAKTLVEQIKEHCERLNGTNIAIESVREGEVPGTHTVTWDSPEDTIVLTHIAKGRRGFALGAVLAAEEIANIQH